MAAKSKGKRYVPTRPPILRGGKYRVPAQVYSAVPSDWDVDALLAEHARLGGSYDIRPLSRRWCDTPFGSYRQVLDHIAEGLKANDSACVELAVRFVECRFIHSYSGYIRSRMARRLKHASFTNEQRQRLSAHFLALLRLGTDVTSFGTTGWN